MVMDSEPRVVVYTDCHIGAKAMVKFRTIMEDSKTKQLYQRFIPRVGSVLRSEFNDHRLVLTVSFPTAIQGQVIKKRVHAGHVKLVDLDTPVDPIGYSGFDDWLGREIPC